MNEPLTVDEIRTQMRAIRRDLRANVQGIVVNASQMFDWRSYVRSFPWTFVAVAAVAGYVLVPRRPTVALKPETEESLKTISKEIHAAAAPRPPAAATLMGTLLPVLGGVALRVGTSYLTRLGSDLLDQMTRSPQGQPSAESSVNAERRASPTIPMMKGRL